LVDTPDFNKARQRGFDSYPAFQHLYSIHENGVMDALMRRLPPKTRADYPQYLEGFRIRPSDSNNLSDFALLGYTGARLPSDGFGIINPFYQIAEPFEFLLEAAGYRYIPNLTIDYDAHANFKMDFHDTLQENVIKIFVGDQHIGYVTRALIPYVSEWMQTNRILDAWVEKKNGNPDQPIIYLYMKVSSEK
jgi:hypothetical protein